MSELVECPVCGCEYPPEATKNVCPECDFADSYNDGEPKVRRFRSFD